MSDDLISRSKTIENLRKIPKIWNGNELLVSFQKVLDYVNSQKTAFDVDEVIEQLDGEIFLTTNDDGETDNLSISVMSADKVMEIVKSGGVADE